MARDCFSHSWRDQAAREPAKHRLIEWLLADSTDQDAKSVSTTSTTVTPWSW